MAPINGTSPRVTRTTDPFAQATATADAALDAVGKAEKELETAQATEAGAKKKLETADKGIATAEAELTELKKDPKKNAGEIAKREVTMEKVYAARTALVNDVAQAKKATSAALDTAKAAQVRALAAEQQADVVAITVGRAQPYAGAMDLDSLDDAASISAAEHQRLLGGVTHVGSDQALAADVKLIKAAAGVSPENGARALALQLKDATPAYQQKLLAAIGPQVDAMVAKMVEKPEFFDESSDKTAMAFYTAASTASPAVRDQLMGKLAKAIGSELTAGSGASNGLAIVLRETGAGFPAATALINKLGPGTYAADQVKSLEASAIKSLRAEFDTKHEKTAKLEAELARLVVGFGPMMEPKKLEQAITAFRNKHAAEFAETETAAQKLSGAYAIASQLTDGLSDGTRQVMDANFPGQSSLKRELGELGDRFKDWSQTQAGGRHLEKALLDDLKNGTGPLEKTLGFVKDAKDGAENLAKGVTRAMAATTLKGDVPNATQAIAMLKRNAGLLGLDPSKLDKLEDAYKNVLSPGSNARIKAAYAEVEAGEFGKSPLAKNAIKAVGVGLGVYSAYQGFSGWGEAGTADRIKTVLDTTKTGADGAALVASMVGRDGVAKALGKFGGLGAITGAIDMYKGISQIVDGNWRDGVGDLALGAGGVVMGIAAVSQAVPGWGQLVGGALIVGGVIWKHTLGTNPAREAEKAAQEDANVFLKAGGMSTAIAESFDDLRQSDHRNIGFFVTQLSQQLKIPLPKLMAKLEAAAKKDPKILEKFASMALDIPMKDFVYAKTRTDTDFDVPEVVGMYTRDDGSGGGRGYPKNYRRDYKGPRSIETAAQWMRDNGLLD